MHDDLDSISILHVDDDADFAELTAEIIQQHDDRFTVALASTADEALAQLSEDGFDCIVSDYEMPGRNGIELLEAVRDCHGDIPFILYTGKGSEEVASDAISAGVTDYLQKEVGSDQYAVLANRIRDAVERSHAQRERKHHLKAIETAEDGISLLDEDGYYTYVNEVYAALYGYEPEDLIGDHWEVVYPDEDVEVVEEEILPTVREHRQWSGTTTGLRADGTTFTEKHNLAMTEEDELVCTVRNAEESTETAPVDKRLLVDTALDHLNDLLYVIGPDGTFHWCNDRLPEVTGFSDEETLSMDAVDFFPEDEHKRICAAIDETLKTGKVVVESEVQTADGDRIPHEFTGYRVSNDGGDFTGLVGTGREMTQQQGREWRLKALNETGHELMTTSSADEIASIGVEAACDIIGLDANAIHLYDEEENGLVPIAQTTPGNAIIGSPPTLKPGESIAWRAFENDEVLAVGDVHADPDVYNPESPIRSELYLTIGDHGILIAASESKHDFDDSDVILGEILVSAIGAALDQVNQTAELREREQELQQQNERLDEFASVVSHDLRNPLQVADGRLELVRKECDSPHIEQVADALDRMNHLIDQLLRLAREGDTVGEIETIELASLASRCWETVDTAEAILRSEGTMSLKADRSQIRQILENLFRNAAEHGGKNVTVTIGVTDDGFYVEDDGPGLPAGDRSSVFDFGYTTSNEGTGFGLNIVKQIADAHGWEIDISESGDGGARFVFSDVELVE